YDCDCGIVEIRVPGTGREEHSAASRQDLWPAVRKLSSLAAQFGNCDRFSSFGWNLRQIRLRIESGDNITIIAPTASSCRISLGERHRLAAIDADFLELSLGEERHPLPIGREERGIGSFCPWHEN